MMLMQQVCVEALIVLRSLYFRTMSYKLTLIVRKSNDYMFG